MNELTFQRNCMKMKSCASLQTVIIPYIFTIFILFEFVYK